MSILISNRIKKVYRGHQHPSYKSLPVIMLKGTYLSKIGFKIGDVIHIELKHEQIIITRQNKAISD